MLLLENWFIYDNLMPLWNYNMFVCTKARPQEDSPAKLCLCLPNKLNSRCLLGSLSASFHAFLVKLHWTLLHFDSPTQQTPQSFLDGWKKAPPKKTPHTQNVRKTQTPETYVCFLCLAAQWAMVWTEFDFFQTDSGVEFGSCFKVLICQIVGAQGSYSTAEHGAKYAVKANILHLCLCW